MTPYSLDIFESQLYWTSKDKGEVWIQDKFGRDEKEKLLIVNPWLTQVRIFHQWRYNQSGSHQPYFKLMAIVFLENGGG